MRNVLLVAKREYLEQIRGRAFRLTTILVPAVFAILIGVGYLSSMGLGSHRHLVIASDDAALANEMRAQMLKRERRQSHHRRRYSSQRRPARHAPQASAEQRHRRIPRS